MHFHRSCKNKKLVLGVEKDSGRCMSCKFNFRFHCGNNWNIGVRYAEFLNGHTAHVPFSVILQRGACCHNSCVTCFTNSSSLEKCNKSRYRAAEEWKGAASQISAARSMTCYSAVNVTRKMSCRGPPSLEEIDNTNLRSTLRDGCSAEQCRARMCFNFPISYCGT
jgi:hypothetical protein